MCVNSTDLKIRDMFRKGDYNHDLSFVQISHYVLMKLSILDTKYISSFSISKVTEFTNDLRVT